MPNGKNLLAPQELLVAGAALKAGIFDALREKPSSPEELAARLALDRRALWTVTEALIALGYLFVDDGKLTLTPETEQLFFDKGSERYSGYALIHTFNVVAAWTHLPEILKTGRPQQRRRDAADIKGFMSAMQNNARTVAAQVADICLKGLPEEPAVIDLGGGPLNYARPFAAAGAAVTVQDLPEVCAAMEPALLPGEKIKFVPGDFTKEVFQGRFDLAFLGNICHIYGEEENTLLFKRVHAALRGGGRIAILDFVRGLSPRAELFAVNMLANTETGGTWTLNQYTAWLKTAGFDQVESHNLADRQMITAVSTGWPGFYQ